MTLQDALAADSRSMCSRPGRDKAEWDRYRKGNQLGCRSTEQAL
jgi:hypothetical protein